MDQCRAVMLTCQTRFFGEMEYTDDSVISFPEGIPGFEQERAFLFVHVPAKDPIMFLQSMKNQSLCFVTLPILTLDPEYHLDFTDDDLRLLDFAKNSRPQIGQDVLCVALISTQPGDTPRANLMAPIVVNLFKRLAIQVIHAGSGYSNRHPILLKEAAACL